MCTKESSKSPPPAINVNGDYFNNRFNKLVSTKATPEQQWDKLKEHILFYSTKQYFFVTGTCLSNKKYIQGPF
jgi:hypothetical protein